MVWMWKLRDDTAAKLLTQNREQRAFYIATRYIVYTFETNLLILLQSTIFINNITKKCK